MKKWRRKPKATTTPISGVERVETPPGWTVVEGRLMREWAFADFAAAKRFVDRVSQVCEQLNHHADVHFGWGYVVLEVVTHDVGDITERDLELARAINQLED